MIRKSFLYVISASDEKHKIGRSNNPESRLKQLQGANPDELKLSCARECEADISECAETLAHQHLAEFRTNGEWFCLPLDKAISSLEEAIDISTRDANTPGPVSHYLPFSTEDLKSWRLTNGLTQSQSAALMGMGLKKWRGLETGLSVIPRSIEFACRYIDEHPEVLSAPRIEINSKNHDGKLLGIRPTQRFNSGSPSDNAILINRALQEPDVEKVIFYSSIRDIREVGIGHRVCALVVTSRTAHLFDQSECHVSYEAPHRSAEVKEFIENSLKINPQTTFFIPEKLLSFQVPESEREATTYLLKSEVKPLTSYDEFHQVARYLDPNVI